MFQGMETKVVNHGRRDFTSQRPLLRRAQENAGVLATGVVATWIWRGLSDSGLFPSKTKPSWPCLLWMCCSAAFVGVATNQHRSSVLNHVDSRICLVLPEEIRDCCVRSFTNVLNHVDSQPNVLDQTFLMVPFVMFVHSRPLYHLVLATLIVAVLPVSIEFVRVV
jgi:hypothetical protein